MNKEGKEVKRHEEEMQKEEEVKRHDEEQETKRQKG